MFKSLFVALPFLFIASFALTMLTACETYSQPVTDGAESHVVETDESHGHGHDEPRPFEADADARLDVDLTLMAAEQSGKLALIVMGANWCHDSRGLASHFEDPEFRAANITPYYQLLYVDVGEKDRNIDIAQEFGVDDIVGTPTVFVVTGEGEVLNLDTAPTWRNAASRTEDEIAAYFKDYGEQHVAKD